MLYKNGQNHITRFNGSPRYRYLFSSSYPKRHHRCKFHQNRRCVVSGSYSKSYLWSLQIIGKILHYYFQIETNFSDVGKALTLMYFILFNTFFFKYVQKKVLPFKLVLSSSNTNTTNGVRERYNFLDGHGSFACMRGSVLYSDSVRSLHPDDR